MSKSETYKKQKRKEEKKMTINEIIARLETLREEHGDIEIQALTDEGDSVEVDVHIERIGEADVLCLY